MIRSNLSETEIIPYTLRMPRQIICTHLDQGFRLHANVSNLALSNE